MTAILFGTPIVVLLVAIGYHASIATTLYALSAVTACIVAGASAVLQRSPLRLREHTTPLHPWEVVLGDVLIATIITSLLLLIIAGTVVAHGDIVLWTTIAMAVMFGAVFAAAGALIGRLAKSMPTTIIVELLLLLFVSTTAFSPLHAAKMEPQQRILLVAFGGAAYLFAVGLAKLQRGRDLQDSSPRAGVTPLRLGNASVHDEIELLDALQHASDDVLAPLHEQQTIARWTKTQLHERRLAKRLQTTDKEKMLRALHKHVERHGNRVR
jgi:hypothetical protein